MPLYFNSNLQKIEPTYHVKKEGKNYAIVRVVGYHEEIINYANTKRKAENLIKKYQTAKRLAVYTFG
jgi:hypothetical protein